ncbi:hypothetical protein ST201phi2-1p056 [Pseudomonas phage 201phi2-1]|uniref:Uncharacterized protein n=1 Tax=Pseudomonas phage 201phi2-1 TaxID=198110 RepID=B3FK31_BP201|nr:hypothetical protein ST201phi2-1p056 [Pseudomonas phage 201phi2-1]ABY62889.1 hypothetical protein 201phi2-1p056 [Pseudomonas phage 201phi2-1]
MSNFFNGKMLNVNAELQSHLNLGGQLVLTVQRDGKTELDFLLNEKSVVKLKSIVEGK